MPSRIGFVLLGMFLRDVSQEKLQRGLEEGLNIDWSARRSTWNLHSVGLEELDEIISSIEIALFKNSELIAGSSLSGFGNVIEGFATS